ncbi:Autophagy-related protein 18 B (Atg18B) [Monocercomonoides exilis]|uniref:Autophagy-related protein 18 B (Atg18B) n=1 Tax=Monocercomonoides exilis TaxID=2049356 RepID=UPI00355A99B7|nr:Autophagy-related protein 18 B (Atg18B) [Monocercomonoides exilis]|eukprot:MONOS_1826.1-p1 / transcript=MONOS_1826.1 / gene=MONOS_1826 / organism=Monocercomonoides_exilis_PA203 / gene_product=Autophagy-related protein 18 B (Atg18B) / transcript_product=Autophagy-related protein 18 B (Atg18B) / location=Mono_scaffold00034:131500-132985(+) / protein_length=360 / sequence_SO=supercontig / SO=protein_coding / is_pseudo=false
MQIRERTKDITFLSFNQTNTCLLVGTKAGYTLWRTDPFDQCTRGFSDHPIHLCEMFFSTSLLAVVCNSSVENFTPRVLYLYNTKIDQVICLLRFNEDIQSVKLNQQYLVVVLKQSIIIYTLEKIEPVCTLDMYFNQTTPVPPEALSNPPIVALCPQKPILAYPCDPARGNVCLARLNEPGSARTPTPTSSGASTTDAETYGSYQILEAHDHPVVALAFRKDGQWLATASAKGTIIRVWDTESKAMVMELKRSSVGRQAHIHSLAFSDDGTMLVVSSSSKTIHIFAIQGEKKSEKSCAFIRLDQEGITETKHISSFKPDNQTIQVAFADGQYFHFRLPPPGSTNKKCERAEHHSLLSTSS